MSTTVSTSGIQSGARGSVRDSNGIPYVLTESSGDIRLWKGDSATPTSFTEVDGSNNPNDANYVGASIAIKSNDTIAISFFDNDTGMGAGGGAKYVEVSSDTWGSIETVGAIQDGSSNGATAISVDANDVAHVAWVDGDTNMGTTYDTIFYANKVGGSWNTAVEVEGLTAEKQCRFPDLTVDADNLPTIAYRNNTDSDLGTAIGNANNATSFTLFDIETSIDTNGTYPSIAVDSSGNHHVTFTQGAGQTNEYDILIREHQYGDAWTTWQTTEVVGTGTYNNQRFSLVVNGTDRYIFLEDNVGGEATSGDIIYFEDTGSGWSYGGALEVGTFSDAQAKWGFWVNFDSDGINRGEGTIDEYDFSNQSTTRSLFSGLITGAAQSINGNGKTADRVVWYLSKSNSPTGNITAKIYAHSGTFGTSSVPTGSALATSDTVDISTLTGDLAEVEFVFSNPITLTDGTKYCISVEYSGGDGSNNLRVGYDGSSPTHGGNASDFTTQWNIKDTWDFVFKIIQDSISPEIDYTFNDGSGIEFNTLSLGGGGTNYDLTASVGSFTLSGVAANVEYTRALAASAGSFTLTGQAATLSKAYNLATDVGTFTLTGVSANFLRTYAVLAAVANYTLTGIAAAFQYGRVMTAEAVAFVVTGNDTALNFSYRVIADTGGFTVSDISTGLLINRSLPTTTGTFTLTGIATDLFKSSSLTASAGTFTLTGFAAGIYRGFGILAALGTFSLTGNDTALQYARIMPVTVGAFTLTGVAATFQKAYNLALTVGTFTLSGVATALTTSRQLIAALGSFTLSGIAATFIKAFNLNVAAGSFTLSGNAVSFLYNKALGAVTGAFTLSAQATGLLYNRIMAASVGSFTLTGFAAGIYKGYGILAALGTFSLSGITANLTAQRLLALAPGTFTLSGIAATFTKAFNLIGVVASYTLTGNTTGLTAARVIALAAASFTLTGVASTLSRLYALSAAAGAFVLTGIASAFTRALAIVAAVVSFTLTGSATGLSVTEVDLTRSGKPPTVLRCIVQKVHLLTKSPKKTTLTTKKKDHTVL